MPSYSDAQKEKIEKKRELINKVMFIPIAILLGIIPLIVRLTYVQPKDGRMNMLFSKVNLDDYYSQYKSTGIIIMAIIMAIFLYLFIEKSEIKIDCYSKIYFASAGMLLLMTILSTVLSDYKEIAIWGVYDRAEGMVMWGCYLLMFIYTFYIVRDEKSYKWVIGSLIFLVSATAILGAFQYAGHDPLTSTKLGLAFVIPKELRDKCSGLTSEYASHKVLGTMYHYDYVGSFGAMVVPLFGVLALQTKGIVKKCILGVTFVASLFVLLGSTSRAGIVGVILAVIVGIIIFGKKIITRWKITLPLSVVLIIILVGFNFATHGSIFSRIPTLVEDAAALFKTSDESFNYKDYIPVKKVINENGEVTFVLQDENILTIQLVNDELQMIDGDNNPVEYAPETTESTAEDGSVVSERNYTTADLRYSGIQILRQDIGVFTEQQPIDAILITINNSGYFSFRLDESGVKEIDSFSGLPLKEIEADSIGFKGKERLGSARGYIWSRSLSKFFKNNLLIGNGPDTFLAYFPQNDRLAKWWAYENTNVLVDKAHNLYLQIGMNQGGVALIAFLILMIAYLIQCMKLYAFKEEYKASDSMGIGIMLAIVGYLGAGLFNDSVVSVAPIFWILLGTGMAINYIQQKAAALENKKAEHKVINLKNR